VGLGLSLVRQIAQRHRGRALCEPREGGGSCFVLELPLA
jgi:signal transduction histidine kinase